MMLVAMVNTSYGIRFFEEVNSIFSHFERHPNSHSFLDGVDLTIKAWVG